MGNNKSLSGSKFCSQFLPEEQAEIDRLFDALSAGAGSAQASPGAFSLQALKQSHVGEALPPEMVTRLFDGMRRVDLTGRARGPSDSVSREQFTAALSHLLKGTSEEKSLVILKMITATEGPVRAGQVQEFTEDLVGAVEHVLAHRQELRGWPRPRRTAEGPLAGVRALAAQLLLEMKPQGGQKFLEPQWADGECDRAAMEDWVFRAPLVGAFLSEVVRRGFLVLSSPAEPAALLPERHAGPGREFESVLDALAALYLSAQLRGEQRRRWRLLFSSRLHGQSFAQLCGRITRQGPCLALLRDHGGHVFGGFASCSWEVKPQFQGDNKCFLFSIAPRMAAYAHTGYNDHFMYLNHGQQTLPNGLGMGGQHGYFGLWVDADFGKGHSRAKPACTTYGSPQLSAEEDFRFDTMEVWAVEEPSERQPVSKKSILDTDPETRALLEASGRTRHSEGLREVPDRGDAPGN